ncbi:tRNA (guanosine(46)-N7)-methyltransferase TrmB [Flectobacillus longus]|uniref:tRNA (guanosine(46)-N7)-methyltransferase TrmB n=1 Tax=Flectobacillus longus TaxID=2984207 RepID=UPI0024B66767|nr:tRNA (guanosine(46)-N7)-methyltransferase TrmB [Flectobacillus longus]MDI9879726.1 tRNA (guanosine(46)-N7)-methyltransferase TrmB [Flectobacillus longus]
MSRKKSDRFALSRALSNVLESGKPLYETIKGQWNEIMFEKKQPIVLELGCGKGEYTVGLAQIFPEKNFIGVDIKGDRIAVGAKFANENSLSNVAFLRTKIHQLLDFFEKDEITEIWITFPDPQPLKSGIKRRLTNPRFLELYKEILKNDGLLHLKTDSELLFDYTLEVLLAFGVEELAYTKDLYNSELNIRHYGIKTRFEQIFTEKGYNINYLSAKFKHIS